MKNKFKLSYAGSAAMTLIALIIMIVLANLKDTAALMLGGILIVLCIWIFKPFNLPYSAGGLFLAFFSLAVGLKPAIVFSGFTQSAVWTLIPALLFGYVLQKTGLGKRIAFAIIKLFKPSYLSLIFALVLIGLILSLMTPSITVRVAIVVPIAVQLCELCKIEKNSKGNALIILTAFAMALVPGSAWVTGVLWGPIIQGMINALPDAKELVTFNSWVGVMFLPILLTTVFLIAGSLLIMKPKEKLSKDAIDAIRNQKLEKMNKHEIITGLTLAAVFVMFVTNKIHGLPDAAVCLIAIFIFFLCGTLEAKDFNIGVNWDLIIFIGMALSLGSIFTETGISGWLAGIIVPALGPIAFNPFVFMACIMLIMFIWRFADVAFFIPTIAIMGPILPEIQQAYQISPLVWVAIFIMAGSSFFMAYQNPWAMMTKSMAGERAFESKHLGIYGIIYFAACMLALFASIPMWINAGLFG